MLYYLKIVFLSIKNPILYIRKCIVDKGRDYTPPSSLWDFDGQCRGATFVVLILTTDLSRPRGGTKKIRQ